MPKATIGVFRIGNVEKVTFKFRVTNPNLIPESCRKQQRQSQAVLEAGYAAKALEEGLMESAKFGRHRSGHHDTGEPMVTGQDGKQTALHAVAVGEVLNDLANLGWVLTDMSYYSRTGKDQAFFVQLDYEKNKKPFRLTTGDVESLAELYADCIWTLFAYNNPDGTITVNLNGRQPGQRPKWLLTAKEANLTVMQRPKE